MYMFMYIIYIYIYISTLCAFILKCQITILSTKRHFFYLRPVIFQFFQKPSQDCALNKK